MADEMVTVGRVYDDVDPEGGQRILVDRLWPRGVSREAAALDRWCKEVAPSDELRRWYDHVEERFEEFSQRYDQQLCDEPWLGLVNDLVAAAQAGPILLLTATKDVAHSHVPILVSAIADASEPRPVTE